MIYTLEFQTSNREESPLGTVSFWVYGENVRITSVAAHALQSWSIVDDENAGTTPSDEYLQEKEKLSQVSFIDKELGKLDKFNGV